MSAVRYRRRGTAIVETEKGILLTAGREGKPFILPGGGAKRGESRFLAALRELIEETNLLPYEARVIFKHLGKVSPTMSGKYKYQDHHTVCIVKASGIPRPGGGDAKRLGYYFPGSNIWISKTTQEIIEKYYEWKKKQTTIEKSLTDDDEGNEDIEDSANSFSDNEK